MEVFATITGAALALFVLYDVLITTLSQRGAGPLTTRWTFHAWRSCVQLYYRFGWRLFTRAGPWLLAAIFVVWYVILYWAWVILFAAWSGSIETAAETENVTFLEVLYFIGSTFSTLGLGDYTPAGFPWTILTSVGALMITSVMTLSISYLVPVLGAAADRRKIISNINIIGMTPEAIIESCRRDEDTPDLDSVFENLTDSVAETAHLSRVYPVLDFVHATGEETSLSKTVLHLFDAITVMLASPDFDSAVSRSRLLFTLRAIDIYAGNLSRSYVGSHLNHSVSDRNLFQLYKKMAGTDVAQEVNGKRLEFEAGTRETLLRFAWYEGSCKPAKGGTLDRELS